MQLLYTILTMLLVVSGTRITAQFIPLPLPLLQILIGALLAIPVLGLHVRLEPELFLLLFIPPLLFVDGWRMPKGQFRQLRTPILLLAFALVFFTILGAGHFIHWLLPQVPLAACFALAAVLSPTDAVAVSAITHGRLPSTLNNLLQGEALMNDASGLVAFKFAVAATLTGVFSITDAGVQFVLVAFGGLAVGVALSYLLGRLRAWMIARGWEDPAPHVLLLLLLPFAAYVAAEHLGLSGILSAVAAGMMQSRLDLLPRQTSTRLLNRSVWTLLEFTFNGLIFLLLGLQLPDILDAALGMHEAPWLFALEALGMVVAIYAILMLLRFVWVYGYWRVSGAVRRLRGEPTRFAGQSRIALSAVLTLGGVRGAVTLAGVMSLPLLLNSGQAFPQRDLLILLAAGVILLSLLVASVALPRILPRLPQDNAALRERELNRHRAVILESAIRYLESEDERAANAEGAISSAEVKARLMSEYRDLLERARDGEESREQQREVDRLEYRLRLQALRTQRLELYRMRKDNELDDDMLTEILRDLDIAEARLHNS
ncbi:sodium/hydrogen antiporter [Ectopseudomonas mendocina]|jgi:Na+/H+ antiporter|uniref:Sodium:proton antiporter n=1 Tax=Ectopseudomonas mendocina S5.2 TaxID=1225174 RepID=A0ABM5VUS5_ECTME|nr:MULTISPECIES: Na+/H+ antiporter [Pseudomonas]MBL0950257.1 Na+/H+ antiporter [Pseudomonas sp.]AEB59366.1 sodium/hydrogen antiporter [Pseudomonas mendocina NK-01]ALN18625.1 sodium:proton antiporter [Pseudomonas mendocina S5.2]KES00525.1 sodium:proton antiporter [Pseudomonas mendocina]MDF2074770.1 Na+/H+ antiporter [Pseudomonas mendocina]